MGKRSAELGDRFERAVKDFRRAVEACSDEQWGAICNAEGWTTGQTAQHVSGQFPNEMMFITACAEGKPLPPITWEQLNAMNETRAAENRDVTKAAVIEELQTHGAHVAAYIRALSDEQLDRTGSLSLADGATVSTQDLIEGGVLIAHVTEHLESIRGAKVRTASHA